MKLTVPNHRPSTARFPAILSMAVALACASAQTHAAGPVRAAEPSESANARQALTNLEQQFWACDYAATTRGLGFSEGALCGEVSEDLKGSKFRGDFRAMLGWWQRNKAAEHLALEVADRSFAATKATQLTSR